MEDNEEFWKLQATEDNQKFDRDPVRWFTPQQARRSRSLARYRCEWVNGGHRCWRPGLDLAHLYPWESGGWTLSENSFVLCRKHHRAKEEPLASFIGALNESRQAYYPSEALGAVRWKPSAEERRGREELLATGAREFIPPMPRDFKAPTFSAS